MQECMGIRSVFMDMAATSLSARFYCVLVCIHQQLLTVGTLFVTAFGQHPWQCHVVYVHAPSRGGGPTSEERVFYEELGAATKEGS